MRLLSALLVCSLIVAALAVPFKFDDDDDNDCGNPDPVQAMDCVKCEIVVQVFHFLNDAIIGGEGEEAAKQKVLKFCKTAPSFFKDFCNEIEYGNLWDAIYKALRDSLGSFYCIVGVQWLNCQSLNDIRNTCGF